MKIVLMVAFLLSVGSGVRAQTWTPEFDSLAKVTEARYRLPHGICRAFALQESHYTPNAVRAEGNYITKNTPFARTIRKHAVAFAKAHGYAPSVLTEIVQRGESHTMWQIMGENLRQMGFDAPFIAGNVALVESFDYFGRFASRLLAKHNGNIAYVASEYNGGAGAIRGGNFRNAGYVRNIVKYVQEFSY